MIDILVVLAYFCAIFGIGLYVGRKQESLESYALGNRNLPWWAILASILAAEISAVGKSIYEYDPNGKATQAYEKLTKEVLGHGRAVRRYKSHQVR